MILPAIIFLAWKAESGPIGKKHAGNTCTQFLHVNTKPSNVKKRFETIVRLFKSCDESCFSNVSNRGKFQKSVRTIETLEGGGSHDSLFAGKPKIPFSYSVTLHGGGGHVSWTD